MKNTKYFNKLCQKILSNEENELLSYEQKVKLINHDKKQALSDRRYESMTYNNNKNSYPVDYTGIGDLVAGLPITDRQKRIVVYRYQLYTTAEIAELIGISQATVNRELADIRSIMSDNMDLLAVEHETIYPKVTQDYE